MRSGRRPTQRCVYHVGGMNDCLRRIAGLNSPASPPLKKTDTSYNNHALQGGKNTHTHTHSTETDKLDSSVPIKNNRSDSLRSKSEPVHSAPSPDRLCAILSKIHFFKGCFFLHSVTFGRIKAEKLHFRANARTERLPLIREMHSNGNM